MLVDVEVVDVVVDVEVVDVVVDVDGPAAANAGPAEVSAMTAPPSPIAAMVAIRCMMNAPVVLVVVPRLAYERRARGVHRDPVAASPESPGCARVVQPAASSVSHPIGTFRP